MIKLGQKARDKITGFTGIVIGKIDYLFGCNQYGLTPEIDKDGKTGETQWFDDGRIVVLGRGILPKEVRSKKNGGPNRDRPRA